MVVVCWLVEIATLTSKTFSKSKQASKVEDRGSYKKTETLSLVPYKCITNIDCGSVMSMPKAPILSHGTP